MELTINGRGMSINLPSPLALLDLFDFFGMSREGRIVEVNDTIFRNKDFSDVVINEGDAIEIVQFMGGG